MAGSQQFGRFLKNLMERRGLIKADIVRETTTSIDYQQLGRYLEGRGYPSFRQLRALSRVLMVSMDAFAEVVEREDLEAGVSLGEYGEPLRRRWQSATPKETEEILQKLTAATWIAKGRARWARAYALLGQMQELVRANMEKTPISESRLLRIRLDRIEMLRLMGCRYLVDHELRSLLRQEQEILHPLNRFRLFVDSSHYYASSGELFLAELLSKRALTMAKAMDGTPRRQAHRGATARTNGKYRDRLRLPGAHLHHGRVLWAQGRHKAAIEILREALSLFKEHRTDYTQRWYAVWTTALLGRVHSENGQRAEGSRMFARAAKNTMKLTQEAGKSPGRGALLFRVAAEINEDQREGANDQRGVAARLRSRHPKKRDLERAAYLAATIEVHRAAVAWRDRDQKALSRSLQAARGILQRVSTDSERTLKFTVWYYEWRRAFDKGTKSARKGPPRKLATLRRKLDDAQWWPEVRAYDEWFHEQLTKDGVSVTTVREAWKQTRRTLDPDIDVDGYDHDWTGVILR